MDWTTLNFLCFQLNTLDMQSDAGVKNLAWFDTDNQLFEKHYPKPWYEDEKFKKFRYEAYAPNVFEKFIAVYLNGVSEFQNTW